MLPILIIWIFYSLEAEATNICRIECDVTFKTIGCFKDSTKRTLPNYILNERDPSIKNYGGRKIEWFNWNVYMPGFVCRCARKAMRQGYDVFGVQFYGECWAGHKSSNDYMSLGRAEADKCLGDDYKPCGAFDRFCVGKQWSNMVYEIVDTTCSLQYEKVGCFRDRHRNPRPLPNYLMNDRDVFHKKFSGKLIDWKNWDTYLPDLACRCAKKAQEKGMTFFGLQFYGECWSGDDGHNTFALDGLHKACTDQCYQPCRRYSKFCVGQNFANYVYKIKSDKCEIEVEAVGCFNEVRNDRALGEEIYNEVDPSSSVFAGHMIDPKDWKNDFPIFLCNCARNAKAKGYDHFGVNNFGSCWSDEVAAGRYNLHGESSLCYEGDTDSNGVPSPQCPHGSMLCTGGPVTNYIYKIAESGK